MKSKDEFQWTIPTFPKYRVKVCLFGSRDFQDYALLCNRMDRLVYKFGIKDVILVSGHARGVDRLGEKWHQSRGYATQLLFHPDYDKYGKKAPLVRNTEMAEFLVYDTRGKAVAFWDGKSPGTKDMIAKCKELKVPLIVVRF